MYDNFLSPEEILRKKEMDGGFIYDDLSEDKSQGSANDETSQDPVKNNLGNPDPKPLIKEKQIPNLGKAVSAAPHIASDGGWKNLPISIIPTGGIFYPDETTMAIRAAEVREIRHFSTVDEDDLLDLEEKLSFILDRCLRIKFPNEGVLSYKDLKQEDRFFIIMAIRDLTFVKGENSILLKSKKGCNTADCPFKDGIELRTGVLTSYKLDEKILTCYNKNSLCFDFTIKKTGKTVKMFIPSIGVTQEITKYIKEASKKNIQLDDGFLRIAPFIFEDWRDLTFESFVNRMRESDYWSKEEYNVYFELSERIKVGTKMHVSQICQVCGGTEVTADITFPGGIRSLFLVSDIFGELLRP